MHRRLSRTPAHRRSLLQNLMSSLIAKERISTTNAKARYLKEYVDKVIDLAKRGSEEDIKKASEYLAQPEKHIPKLFSTLVARYQHRNQEYAELIKNGTRGGKPDSDHAEMAIIELKDSTNSVKSALARKHLNHIKSRLQEIQSQKYLVQQVQLRNPFSHQNETLNMKQLTPKPLPVVEKSKLTQQESKYRKLYQDFLQRVDTYATARNNELLYKEPLEKKMSERTSAMISKFQKEYDEKKGPEKKEMMETLHSLGFGVLKSKIFLKKIDPIVPNGKMAIAEQEFTQSIEMAEEIIEPTETKSDTPKEPLGFFGRLFQ